MFQLRDYQQDAVAQAFKHLTNAELPGCKPVICLPTGAGKSLVIAEIARVAVSDFKGRVLVLQHRKELIEQNTAKIQALLPGYNVGLYSAGLKRRDTLNNIVVAGIQSVYNKAAELGNRNLVIIDECHLVPERDETMYARFLLDMQSQCRCRVVGLTATPYRTGNGLIYGPDRQFTHLIEPEGADIPTLIERGLLCSLISSTADASVDTSNLHIRAGEFIAKECEQLFGEQEILSACNEIIAKTQDRHSILVFSTSVIHATAIASILHKSTGATVELLHAKTPNRDAILERFRKLQTRFLVNVDVLTTGFDAPVVDCVAILRATASPGLYAQIVGRGMRPHPSKQNCLVLDFGENITRHGPIDRVRPAGKPYQVPGVPGIEEPQETEPQGKICPECQVAAKPETLECECGFRFEVIYRHNATTDQQQIVAGSAERYYEVDGVLYRAIGGKNRAPVLMVQYLVRSNGKTLLPDDLPTRFISFSSQDEKKAEFFEKWWSKRTSEPFPANAWDAAKIAKSGLLAEPVNLMARKDSYGWKITEGPLRQKDKKNVSA